MLPGKGGLAGPAVLGAPSDPCAEPRVLPASATTRRAVSVASIGPSSSVQVRRAPSRTVRTPGAALLEEAHSRLVARSPLVDEGVQQREGVG